MKLVHSWCNNPAATRLISNLAEPYDDFERTTKKIFKAVWQNHHFDKGYRLTNTGFSFLKDLGYQCWSVKVPPDKLYSSNILIKMDQKFDFPYYIPFSASRLIKHPIGAPGIFTLHVFNCDVATNLILLDGDIEQYFSTL